MRDPNVCRTVRFQPYRKGSGPTFTLTLNDARWPSLRYRLSSGGRVLFEGMIVCPGTYASDANRAVVGVMGFLTLRPGDTDADYFAEYTPDQLAFANEHAETLACAVADRFPEGK